MSIVTVEREGDLAWVTISNPPVNAASAAVREGLMAAVEAVRDARLAALRCEGRTFVAGGDIAEFGRPPAEPHLPDVVDAIEGSEVPWLALLHGTVLGGGFEIAMACTWRIARPGTRFGLPETRLGLIPGAGGTQRAPRLLGYEAAIAMACEGRTLDAHAMLEHGGIDAVADDLAGAAREHLAAMKARPLPVSARAIDPMPDDVAEAARERLRRSTKGAAAPFRALEALGWAHLPYGEGRRRERATFLALRDGPESRALRHLFFAEREAKRPAAIEGARAWEVRRVAVFGGGLMGAGIATACLGAGLDVALVERDAEAAEGARGRVAKLLASARDKGRITEDEHTARLASLVVSADTSAAADVDLVIEAIVEDLDAKRKLFRMLGETARGDALLATNTSYLDPRAIVGGVPHSGRCLGLHFFSPAHVMRLVEVARLPGTSADALATAFRFAAAIGKLPVLVGAAEGFIGNRVLSAYRRAAEYMLADGALPWEIDRAMREFGMAMGPFEMQDMAGHAIAHANRRRGDATRDPTVRYVALADELFAMGRHGQRAGAGWYDYAPGERTPHRSPVVERMVRALGGTAERSAGPIAERLLAVMANEGALIVDEGVAESAAAIDLVKVHGYGFPRHRGGPMWWAKEAGDERVAALMAAVAAASPGSWRIAPRFAGPG